MIDINFNNKYDPVDAGFEILIMLVVAFSLGYLLAHIINKNKKAEEIPNEKTELKLIKFALENCINEKSEIKKNIKIEYSAIIDEYKTKLNQAREDLERCLSQKNKS